ncbi:MAG: hypothetical protein DI598_04060 [Pseudopedobacter saltans]|uniref:Phage tail protein n=1 Tax=Pseudopedobacter saltans TaxID=151895 RepID=A0A2W5H6B7_9SPHI|nr:MAG: hypothetical protein DI598_04060 [Pseudopedobacter saltans]
MSFLAKLNVDGNELNVLECSFSFSQDINAIGQPSSIPVGGTVELTVESTGGTNLFDWMISATQVKSGTVTFYRRDAMSKLKELIFKDAHCIDYNEHYKHNGEFPMQTTITISANVLTLNDSQFKNNWSK